MSQQRFSKITEQMMKKFPKWSKIRRNKKSVGAEFLNVFGLQLEDIEFFLKYIMDNMFIDTVDLNQVDIIYKATLPASLTPESRFYFVAEGLKMDQVETLKEFLNGIDTSHMHHKEIYYKNPIFIDWERKVVYVKRKYGESADYTEGRIEIVRQDAAGRESFRGWIPTSLHHVWNTLDEFGLLLSTPRLYGERNIDYKERILDVFRNPANASKEGLQNHLARELGLRKKEVWYDGGLDMTLRASNIILQTIKVDGVSWPENLIRYDRSGRLVLVGQEAFSRRQRSVDFIAGLSLHTFHNKRDLAFQSELYTIDRIGTPMLKYYVDLISNEVPIMWNQFIWGESFWDVADVEMSGYGYIPNYNDARFLNWKNYK